MLRLVVLLTVLVVLVLMLDRVRRVVMHRCGGFPSDTSGTFDAMTAVELYGGPLDGQTVDVDETDADPWIAITSDHREHPGGRSLYAPDKSGTWRWVRDLRWDEL